jgi:hypothetical protein
MKKKFLLFTLLLSALTVQAQQVPPSLGIDLKDGFETYYLDYIQKITFSNGNMVIAMTEGEGGSFAISSIKKVFFYSTGSVQRETLKDFFVWAPVTQELTVRCAAGTPIRIYSAGGQSVFTAIQSVTGAPINLSTLPKGIYIVEAAQKTTKILRR